MSRKLKAGIICLTVLVFVIWWCTAPRYIHFPKEVVETLAECRDLYDRYPEKEQYDIDEFEARGQAIRACREAQMQYYRNNPPSSKLSYLLQPPKAIDRTPGTKFD